jgi:hypothetical protein
MCCFTFILRERLLKGLLLLLSFFYLGLSGWLLYMGVLIKSSGLWKIISDNSMFVEGLDLHNLLFMSLIGCGCFCFLTSFMSFVTICKASKLKLCYLPVIQCIYLYSLDLVWVFNLYNVGLSSNPGDDYT